MKPLIQTNNISKKFVLQHNYVRPQTIKEAVSGSLKKWMNKQPQTSVEDFWALRNISFDLYQGDRLGIIGHNGAGKSTLLKILSRIIPPTTGTARVSGKMASLLEVGTGFHPDLTGRENIYLNGTILGMKENEINKRFDEIVAFAGVEKFLDTPVKKYSSGMFARLGFSIAAHLDPDILIVDEVLSVGDIQFQEKCLKKLDSMSEEGRTILFVSHNIGAVLTVCNKGLYLKNGQIAAQGDIESCVHDYMQCMHNPKMGWQGIAGDHSISIHSFKATSDQTHDYVRQGETVNIETDIEVHQPSPGLIFGFDLQNQRGFTLASTRTTDHPEIHLLVEKPGRYKLRFSLDTVFLRQGDYRINAFAMIHNERYIPLDPVTIQLSIYPASNDLRFRHPHRCEGLFIGNEWMLTPLNSGVHHG